MDNEYQAIVLTEGTYSDYEIIGVMVGPKTVDTEEIFGGMFPVEDFYKSKGTYYCTSGSVEQYRTFICKLRELGFDEIGDRRDLNYESNYKNIILR